MDTQNLYQKAIRFAASKHAEQNQLVVTSTLPYTVHLGNVAIEIPLACRQAMHIILSELH
jgi:guanosine-3',5'-bis(diphosphate) 3'-pyrophosphohydrolase